MSLSLIFACVGCVLALIFFAVRVFVKHTLLTGRGPYPYYGEHRGLITTRTESSLSYAQHHAWIYVNHHLGHDLFHTDQARALVLDALRSGIQFSILFGPEYDLSSDKSLSVFPPFSDQVSCMQLLPNRNLAAPYERFIPQFLVVDTGYVCVEKQYMPPSRRGLMWQEFHECPYLATPHIQLFERMRLQLGVTHIQLSDYILH